MVFPHNEAVANVAHKKRKGSSGAKNSKRSITGSNDPVPLQILPVLVHEDLATTANGPVHTEPGLQVTPRKKMAIKKKLTPKKKLQIAPDNTISLGSPAFNTRSKKLNM
ncbi:hypothetical protein PR202_ga09127 [Eleusine coracana subsp. coracana]|uniref:Uncharacterized protein n=1 Tax=Eleusine coracana subsp. coracana TaxID=191504 RepID=A0AAV5C1V4_ELECO|nr:hypothetical protein PR202_ga09127 [Eleusine coracana subsp. coracana]